jgi:hypothetical protein
MRKRPSFQPGTRGQVTLRGSVPAVADHEEVGRLASMAPGSPFVERNSHHRFYPP